VAAAGIWSVEDQYRRHKPIVVRIEDNWVQGSDVGTPWGHVGSVDQACTKLSRFTYLNNTFWSFFQFVVSGGRNALFHVAVKILTWCHQTHDTFMRSMHAITEPTNHRIIGGTGNDARWNRNT
jgi:hypothetical protein